VVGDDPTGASVSLQLLTPGTTSGAPPGDLGSNGLGNGATATAAGAAVPAIVQTATVDASGAFTLDKVPSPSVYVLVVAKPGFASDAQQVNLGAGEQRNGVTINLRKGDGSISGHVTSATGPLGGATITASDGRSTVTTVSLTQDDVGAFTLDHLPTPGTFTVVVSKPGFASQTLTLGLASAQRLTDIGALLAAGVGSVSGRVTLADNTPAGGVTVTVTNGDTSLQTVTLSVGDAANIGTYQLTGLAIPNTYTITFARSDLTSQTRAVDLDALGHTDAAHVDASLSIATATISGTVAEAKAADQGGKPLAGVEVVVSSGTKTYKVTSASIPTEGAFEIGGIPPGSYTVSFNRRGTRSTSSLVTLRAGERKTLNPALDAVASIVGRVLNENGLPVSGAEIRLFLVKQYPNVVAATAISDGAGRFTFPAVDAPETYVIEFAFPRGTPAQKSVQKTTAESTTLDLGDTVLSTG
jgi:hypothetical protein